MWQQFYTKYKSNKTQENTHKNCYTDVRRREPQIYSNEFKFEAFQKAKQVGLKLAIHLLNIPVGTLHTWVTLQ